VQAGGVRLEPGAVDADTLGGAAAAVVHEHVEDAVAVARTPMALGPRP
jgi:hypothetical protein